VKIIATHDLTTESMNQMGQSELLWIYNGSGLLRHRGGTQCHQTTTG
jgi:hypothetical protein